jgi:hypothetical protein
MSSWRHTVRECHLRDGSNGWGAAAVEQAVLVTGDICVDTLRVDHQTWMIDCHRAGQLAGQRLEDTDLAYHPCQILHIQISYGMPCRTFCTYCRGIADRNWKLL